MTDALDTLDVTLHPRIVLGVPGHEYEVRNLAGQVVAEGWCSATKDHAEAVAKKHAYRNIARRARKGRAR